jgi:hypothetical protein
VSPLRRGCSGRPRFIHLMFERRRIGQGRKRALGFAYRLERRFDYRLEVHLTLGETAPLRLDPLERCKGSIDSPGRFA